MKKEYQEAMIEIVELDEKILTNDLITGSTGAADCPNVII